jgi:hypothetical protein
MGENGLLAPHRVGRNQEKTHDGTIATDKVNEPKNGNWHVRVWLRLVHFHGHDARSLRLWPSPVG